MIAKARPTVGGAFTRLDGRELNHLENGSPRAPFPRIGPALAPTGASKVGRYGCGFSARVERTLTATLRPWMCFHPEQPDTCPDMPQGASA